SSHRASGNPTSAARAAKSRLSKINWRLRRPGLAPRAARMPYSVCRAAERASRRLATLAHAISSTSTHAAPRMASGHATMLDAPSCALQMGTIRAPIPRLVFGKLRARRAAIAAKFRRRYADDGDRVPIDPHGAAEDGLVRMKIVLPQPIADDGRERFGPVAVFVTSERATQDRLYAQDVEIVSGDPFVPHGIGLFSLADRGGAFLVQQQSGNTAKAVLEVPGVGVRNLMLHAAGTDGLKHRELSVVPGT